MCYEALKRKCAISIVLKEKIKISCECLLSMTVCHDPPLLVFSSGLFTLFALSPQLSLSLSHKSTLHTSSSLHYCLGFVRPPSETWHHTPPFQRSRNAAWSLPSVYSISPFICWDKKCKAAPTWISLSPPVGTCAGHFRSHFRAESTRGKERLT